VTLGLLVAASLACGPFDTSSDLEPTVTPTPSPTATPSPTPPPRDRYRSAPCEFGDIPGETAECGFLTVPEVRERREDGDIELHVAVVKSRSDTPLPDPVVYLEGGPGAGALQGLDFGLPAAFEAVLEERDLVLFDQRGTGYSRPYLGCPEVGDVTIETLRGPTTPSEGRLLYLDAYRACRDRLQDEGVALDGYNSAESAADMDDLRQALGYDQWNVYGISYGTRLALTYMRDFPDATRSAVLDSTYSPEVDLTADVIAGARRALDVLFTGCAADDDCGSTYPNLERDFFAAIRTLDEEPAPASVLDASGNTAFQAQITGDELLLAVFYALYSDYYIPAIPRVMALAAERDLSPVGAMLGIPVQFSESISAGMYTSVQCNEDISFSSRSRVEAAARPYPELYHFVDTDISFPLCDLWGAGEADDIENEPIATDIPTLVLAGEYDPITPPSWGRAVADRQTPGYFYEYRGLAHGVTVSGFDCPVDMMLAFLHEPQLSPAALCMASLPDMDYYVF
jgi:pimeloyl-ACP methyl ester carboxylesterase